MGGWAGVSTGQSGAQGVSGTTGEPRGCLQSRWGGSSPQRCAFAMSHARAPRAPGPRASRGCAVLTRFTDEEPGSPGARQGPCRPVPSVASGLLGAGVTSQSTCAPRASLPLPPALPGAGTLPPGSQGKISGSGRPPARRGGVCFQLGGTSLPTARLHPRCRCPLSPCLSHREPVSFESLALPQACSWVLGAAVRFSGDESGEHRARGPRAPGWPSARSLARPCRHCWLRCSERGVHWARLPMASCPPVPEAVTEPGLPPGSGDLPVLELSLAWLTCDDPGP